MKTYINIYIHNMCTNVSQNATRLWVYPSLTFVYISGSFLRDSSLSLKMGMAGEAAAFPRLRERTISFPEEMEGGGVFFPNKRTGKFTL